MSVDGGRTILDEDCGSSLLTALDLARKKLGCYFQGWMDWTLQRIYGIKSWKQVLDPAA